jgi:hypothetical protein
MRQRATRLRRASCSNPTGDDRPMPRYAYPLGLSLSIAVSVVLGRKRAFGADAEQLIHGIVPEPCVENAHWIPREDPFIVVTNHYCRPGYGVWWGIALITAAIAQCRPPSNEIVWLMTNRWTYPDPLRSRLITPLTRLVFTRVARTYGFVPTPPMPPQSRYTEEGARSVRHILSLLGSSANAGKPMIGLAPEGRDGPDGSLIEPPSGTGRFLLHMARHGLEALPVGVAEINGVLTARFGPPFALGSRPELNKKEQDHQASAQVMVAIGTQLPRALWGAFRAQIERVVGQP